MNPYFLRKTEGPKVGQMSATCPPVRHLSAPVRHLSATQEMTWWSDLSAPVRTCPHLSAKCPPSVRHTREDIMLRPVHSCPHQCILSSFMWRTIGGQVWTLGGPRTIAGHLVHFWTSMAPNYANFVHWRSSWWQKLADSIIIFSSVWIIFRIFCLKGDRARFFTR